MIEKICEAGSLVSSVQRDGDGADFRDSQPKRYPFDRIAHQYSNTITESYSSPSRELAVELAIPSICAYV